MPSAWFGPQTNRCRQTRPFIGPWEFLRFYSARTCSRCVVRGRAFILHAHLGRDRAGIAHALVVIDLISALEIIEVAGQQRVAVEVEQAALFGQQEAEILLGSDLGDLAQRLVLGVVISGLGAAVSLFFEIEQLPL